MKHIVNNVKKWPSFSIAYIFLALLIFVILQSWLAPNVENVSYSKFKKYIADGKLNSVVVSTKLLKGYEKTVGADQKEPLFPKKIFPFYTNAPAAGTKRFKSGRN